MKSLVLKMNIKLNKLKQIVEHHDWYSGLIQYMEMDLKQDPQTIFEKIVEELNSDLSNCNSGMVLGIGYHGGMTSEEWEQKHDMTEKLLNDVILIDSEIP